MEIPKASKAKKTPPAAPAKSSAPAAAPKPPKPPKPPPLFRPIDWAALIIVFVLLFVAYYITIAPEMTLEDSGELATGSFYAGIPHPPGYPVWTMFTYLWTLIPFGNVAWRVALASAFAGALASGLLAFVVSRGSSMIIESIDELKGIGRRWENLICLVSGMVAGGLLGFNGYMWSQAVIVEVYPLSVVSLMGVVVCLLRWMYAPHQHRYLYGAFFLYGICVNNHQSLLVIAMGMEALIFFAEPKLGREIFFWNTILYLAGLVIHPEVLAGNTPVFVIFNIIGIASAILWVWQCMATGKKGVELGRDMAMLAMAGCAAIFFLAITNYLPNQNNAGALFLSGAGALGFCLLFIWLIGRTRNFSKEWLATLGCGGSWLLGAAFYLFEPISCATDPPMQWGYPRTLEGFIHTITRGQYEKIHPTSGQGSNAFQIIGNFFATYGTQLWRYLEGLSDEFNLLYLLIALVVFLFYLKMKRRERVWVLGMVSIWICLGPFLVLLLNFPSDRQSLELNRVFLTSSHVFISMFVGFGLTLLAACAATNYAGFRKNLLLAAVCAVDFALFMLVVNSLSLLGNLDDEMAARIGYAKLSFWLLGIGSILLSRKYKLQNDRFITVGLPSFFIVLSLGCTFWAVFSADNFGVLFHSIAKAFSPDQYGIPIYAGLIIVAMALVFWGAVAVARARAPLGWMLAVFVIMPAYSALMHWSDNEQRQHWFGYYFGHDMFTPPVVGSDGKMTYDAKVRAQMMKGPDGKMVYPEMARNAILFGGTDPGRFAPTYMIFCDSFIPHHCQPVFDRHFDRRDVYIITQNALADGTYLEYLRAQYFRSAQYKYDRPFFEDVLRGPKEREENYTTNFIARIAGRLLDAPITAFGARVEARRRREGVYPPNEIYIPSPEDSQQAFSDYMKDAEARIEHDQLHPNEPHEVKPGEDIHIDQNGRVQVSGQIAVMSINGLLTKVIFDHNPTNEFYVEESFPLDWMYPHLTPYGVIMKIHRKEIPEITEDMCRRDHEFWSKYSERLIGNWITYDTSVKDITAFIEKVYLRRDYSGFKGDRKFIRDDDAQKSFSKLRSSIGGIYSWRLGLSPSGAPVPAKYLPKSEAERKRMEREAEFAYKQAFAFCPYSPEAVFRYVNLLMTLHRFDDAVLVAKTCQKLDPYNDQIAGLVNNIEAIARQMGSAPGSADVATLENEIRANPTDFQKQFDLFSKYMQMGQGQQGMQVLDGILTNPHVTISAVLSVAGAYSQLRDLDKVAQALQRLVQLAPNSPEAWYDLAATEAALGRTNAALTHLQHSMQLNAQRLAQNPKTNDLRATAAADGRFAALHNLPEFKKLVAH